MTPKVELRIALTSKGNEKPLVMGCYGIGVSRVVAAAIEQNHDANGIIFPVPLAPYPVSVALQPPIPLLWRNLVGNGGTKEAGLLVAVNELAIV